MTALHHHQPRAHVVIVDHMLLPVPVLLAVFGVVAAAAAGLTVSGLVKRYRGKHDPVLRAVSDQVARQVSAGSASLRQQVAALEAKFAVERQARRALESALAAERQARGALSDSLAQALGAAGMTVPAQLEARPELKVVRGRHGAA